MSIFGPSQKETWTKLNDHIHGQYIKGGIWKADKIELRENKWTITLDTFATHAGKATIPFTRMRAPFVSKDNFRFTLNRRNFFSPIADFFGRKSATTGHPDFDKQFVIKCTDDYKLKKLFANDTLRELILSQKEIHLEIKDKESWPAPKFPADVDELYFQASGILKDVERLERVFKLFKEVLNQLVVIGSAYEREAGVVLK